MAGPINPAGATYLAPAVFVGTDIKIPAGYITGYELRISVSPDMSNARVIRDSSVEAVEAQSTPLPTDMAPGQYYADLTALVGTQPQTRGPVGPFEIKRLTEAPRNFLIA